MIALVTGCRNGDIQATEPVTTSAATAGTVTAGTVTSEPDGPTNTAPIPTLRPRLDDTPSGGTCLDDTPVTPLDIGTVNTIVVPANADDFEVVVEADPPIACPGDIVAFDVTVRNASATPSRFTPNRGLLFTSGGMANWSLGALGPVEIAPGDTWSATVTGEVPPVRPGVYAVRPEGIAADGTITVLDPTTARPAG